MSAPLTADASNATAPPGGWLGSLTIAIAAFLLFLLLPQRTLHGVDGNQFVVWIEEGHLDYARHVGYLHFCGLIHRILVAFGQPSGFAALQLSSAIGAAFGLFCLHRAFRRPAMECDYSAFWCTLAVLITPAWFFYATTAEIPGVFAAGCGAAWWAFARWLDGPTLTRAAVLGLACAATGALHSFGHLLTPAFVLIAWLWKRTPDNRWAHVAVLGLVHAAIAILVPRLLGAGASGQAQDAMSHLEERWRTFAPLTAPTVFWHEWLVPYAPWSLLSLLALAVPRARAWGLAVAVLLLLHMPVNVLLLGAEQIREDGAYLIALAPPAILATLHLLPRRFAWPCLAVSVAVSVHLAAPGWPAPISPAFGAGVFELNREHRIALVVAGQAELDGARTATPGLMVMNLAEVIGAFVQTRKPDQTFANWFDTWTRTFGGLGMRLVLSEQARRFFAEGPDADLRQFWDAHLPSHYQVTQEQRQGFVGVSITPK